MIGTPAQVFPSTHWSVVLAAGQRSTAQAAEALEELCRAYWYPLYAYVRRHGYAPADAEDLVQGFIAHLLGHHFFQTAHPVKGRFRSYLLTSLNHFLADARDYSRRVKRGDGQLTLSLDLTGAEARYALETASPANPQQLFERKWALALLERALRRLEAEAGEADRTELFRQIKGTLLGDRSRATYAQLAPQLGMSEAALTMSIYRFRRRYRELVREEIAHTVSSPVEVEEELRQLFQALGG